MEGGDLIAERDWEVGGSRSVRAGGSGVDWMRRREVPLPKRKGGEGAVGSTCVASASWEVTVGTTGSRIV